MSELNNNDEDFKVVEEIRKKKHPVRNTIIFLIFFTVICVGTTGYLIYTNNLESEPKEEATSNTDTVKKEKKKNNIKKEVEYCEGIKSREEMYNINDIKITEKKFHEGNVIDKFNDGTVQYRLEVNYIEIDGLKDKDLQKQINKRIKDTAMEMYTQKEVKDDKIREIGVSVRVEANFENVLSMDIEKQIGYKDESKDWDYEYQGLNINLIDGKDIAFEELFTKDAPIKNILNQVTYEELVQSFPRENGEMFEDLDMSKVDYSAIEDEVLKIMYKYNSSENINFTFSSDYITAYINGYLIPIRMFDYYKYIAIYNRYKSDENLFDGKYKMEKNNLVLTDTYDVEHCRYYKVGRVSDNLFVSIRIYKSEEENKNINKKLDEIQKEFEEKIEKYKNLKDGKVRYIMASISNYSNTEEDCNISILTQEFEADKEYFNSDFIEKILDSMQKPGVEIIAMGYIELPKEMQKKVKMLNQEDYTLEYNASTKKFEKKSYE